MFTQDSKLAVLESKLSIYEELSREMLSKLESAVDKISEGNLRIATILTKHDERIEQSIKTDELFVKKMDELKQESDIEYKRMYEKFKQFQIKLDELSEFRWRASGIIAFVIILLTILQGFYSNFQSSKQPQQVIIERVK